MAMPKTVQCDVCNALITDDDPYGDAEWDSRLEIRLVKTDRHLECDYMFFLCDSCRRAIIDLIQTKKLKSHEH